MKNGAFIGTPISTENEATEVISKYFSSEFWAGFTDNPNEGEISPKSFYIKNGSYAPLPCAAGCTLFTYANDVQFVAGYIKHVSLCGVVRCIFSDMDELTEFSDNTNISFNIDLFAEIYILRDDEKKAVFDEVKNVLRLCNASLLERDEMKAKELVFLAVNEFNEYFSNVLGWSFILSVYEGIDNAREDILGYINNEYLRDGVSEIISFDTWSDTERLILENVLENIVG